jgi:peptidoglycan hydrolase CwlO-like protein
MNSDFGKATEIIFKIMENVSSLKEKILKEEKQINPDQSKISVWKKELVKAEKALDKRRTMA